MLIDGISLIEGSSIVNSHIESSDNFPSSPTKGRMFYLSTASGGNAIGLYVYNGTSWVTGDVTSVNSGTGLLGGGTSGDIALSVDTSVISTTQNVTDSIATAVTTVNASISDVQDQVTQNTTDIQGKQPLNADLTSVAALTGTGLAKRNGNGDWALDSSTYLTANQTITASGDATGSGTTSLALTLANSGVTAGTYTSVTVDAKGRATSGSNVAYLTGNQTITVTGDVSGSGTTAITLTLPTTGVTPGTYKSVQVDAKGRVVAGATPTTLAGYSITDAVNKTGDTMTGNLTMSSGTHITINDAPVSAMDATNKAYVDSLVTGLNWKQAVNVATDSNITLSGHQTIDNVALVDGDRVLVKSQTTQSENGIYIVDTGAWSRALDMDASNEFSGSAVLVKFGDVYTNSGFTCTNSGSVTVGTTSITFVQFNGASGVIAGSGLSKSGNTLSLTNTGVTASTYTSVTVGLDGRVTAGSNPTTLAGYGITDAMQSGQTIDGGSY